VTDKLLRLACACLFASVCALSADAQEERTTQEARTGDAATRQSTSSADRDFDLDIPERRITEESFEASLSVALGAESLRGLDLRVGVAVGASRIDVLLRNVRGHVRFRATLGQVLRLLNERRSERPAAGTPTIDAPASGSPAP